MSLVCGFVAAFFVYLSLALPLPVLALLGSSIALVLVVLGGLRWILDRNAKVVTLWVAAGVEAAAVVATVLQISDVILK